MIAILRYYLYNHSLAIPGSLTGTISLWDARAWMGDETRHVAGEQGRES